jgi:hypothetical protein
MALTLTDNKKTTKFISKKEYNRFYKEYIFDKLQNILYGEAFCKKFNIRNPILSMIQDEKTARHWIETSYIK